jgi:CheY-like chemotaxis protein
MKNILVVEDDPANLQIFVALLWSKGHDVVEASTAHEALDAARRKERLDLLVSDIELKGDQMTGTEVATALLDIRGILPIIFVTGTPLDLWDEADRQNLRELRSKSRVAILEKPFMPLVFESAVDSLLEGADLSAGFPAAIVAPNMLATGIKARPISGPARSV